MIKITVTNNLRRETLITSYINQGHTENTVWKTNLLPPMPSSMKGSRGRSLEAGAWRQELLQRVLLLTGLLLMDCSVCFLIELKTTVPH